MPQNRGLEIEAPRRARGYGTASVGAPEPPDLPDLPWTRLTQRPRPPRDQRMGWLVAIVVVVVFGVLVWQSWNVRPVRGEARPPIIVRILGPSENLHQPPELAPPAPLTGAALGAPPRIQHEKPAPGAIQATIKGVEEPPLKLYGSNGQVRLPPTSAPPTSAYRNPGVQGSEIYSGKSPVPYKQNPFNEAWAPSNQSLGSKALGHAMDKLDKAVEKTTVTHEFKLPGGVKIRCGISPLALAAGCGGEPPQPPPANDNDIRLSMPPAETLTGKKVAVPKVAPPANAAAFAPESTRAPAVHRKPEPCPVESQDAKTANHPREACREHQPLPAGGRS